jgi:hypothetical protein
LDLVDQAVPFAAFHPLFEGSDVQTVGSVHDQSRVICMARRLPGLSGVG